MALDATGTPSSLGIPKLATNTDAPSGKGINAIVDSLDVILKDTRNFNVKDYGAIGNGIADDTAAIQAAITAATAAGGGIVYLPRGTYLAGTILCASNVTITGAGVYQTTVKSKAALNAPQIGYPSGGLTNVCVTDLTIDGNKTNQSATTATGIVFPLFTNSSIRRVRVINTYGIAIQIFQGSDITVDGCTLNSIGQGNSSDGSRAGIMGQAVTRMRVTNNRLVDINDTAILLPSGCSACEVSNNNIDDAYFIGIGLGAGGTQRVVIADNVIRNTANASGIDTGDATGVSVTGNVIDACQGGICPDLSALGARTDAALVISGNVIRNITTAGILVIGPQTLTAHNVVITNNTIDNCGQHGIAVSAIREATIAGNVIRNVSTALAGFAGIRIDAGIGPAGSQGILVIGNRIYDTPASLAIDRGTGGAGATNNNYNIYIGNSTRGCLTSFAGTAGANDVQVNNI